MNGRWVWSLAAGLVVLAVVAVVDALTAGTWLTPLLLVGPVLVSIGAGPRRTAPVGVIAVALALLAGVYNGVFLSDEHVVAVTVVATASGLAVANARERTRASRAAARALRAAEERAATRRRLDGIVAQLAEAVTVQRPDGHMVYANQAAADLLGYATPEELIASAPGEVLARFDVLDEEGRTLGMEDFPGTRLAAGRPAEPLLVRNVVRATGEERWLLTKATRLEGEDGPLAISVIENVTETKRAELAQRLLAQAGEELASSLDFDQTIRNVARLAVPTLADWCAVLVREERGGLRQVAVAHPDPDKERLAWRLNERYPPDPDAPVGAPNVIRTGEMEVINDIPDALLEAAAPDEEVLGILRDLGLRASVVAPLEVGGRTVGALSLVAAETKARFSEADVDLAAELARRAGTALESARLYGELREIATTLQEGLSPAELPAVEGWETASLYRAAGEGNQVGGDFYDLFRVDDGWIAMIGDVTGKGVHAAALTALVRYTARATARFTSSPARILRHVNDALRDQQGFLVCTASCLRLRDDGEVTVVNAGHPPALWLRGGGAEPLGEHGLLLGAFEDVELPEARLHVEPGDAFLLYTDGVLEARGPEDRFGDRRLMASLDGHDGEPAGMVARVDRTVARFRAAGQEDDMALLALRRVREPAGAGAGSPAAAQPVRSPAS